MIEALGSTISGAINSSRKLPTMDMAPLIDTINKSGQYQQGLINSLPANLKALIAPYVSSMNTASSTLQSNVEGQGQDYLSKIAQLYGPDSPAAQAAMNAFKQQAYSTLPGTLNATKAQLAATGGLGRGAAAKGIASAIQAPATAVSQNAATVTAQQLQAGQQATQQALATVNSMEEGVFQQQFGMSKDMATNILNSGRSDLKDQLSQLITQNTNQTSQMLGVQGIAANNAYQNAVTRNQQAANNTSNLVNLGLQGAQMAVTGGMGGGAGAAFPQGEATMGGALPNPASMVPGMGSGGSGLNLF